MRDALKKKRLFLQWLTVAGLTASGTFAAIQLGWLDIVWFGDATRLSLVTLALFAAGSLWCGLLAWQLDAIKESGIAENESYGFLLKKLKIRLGHGWHAVNACVEFGLLGTVFGLYMMLNGDAPIGDDGEAAKAFVAQIKGGMATAFLTTIVGGICGIALGFQVHMLSQAAEEAEL